MVSVRFLLKVAGCIFLATLMIVTYACADLSANPFQF